MDSVTGLCRLQSNLYVATKPSQAHKLDFSEVVNGSPSSTIVPPPSVCSAHHGLIDLISVISAHRSNLFIARLHPTLSLPDFMPFLSAVLFFLPLVQLLSSFQIQIQTLPFSQLFLITYFPLGQTEAQYFLGSYVFL